MSGRKNLYAFLEDVRYGYDLQGNIVSVVDSGANPRQQTFFYDNLHRLVQSEGAGSWGNVPLTYNTHFAYSPAGRLVEKDQCALRLDNMYGVYPVCGDYKYSYPARSSDNPYAAMYADEIYQGDRVYFKWTESGAMKQADAHDMMRRQCWDEEGRMQSSFRGDGRGACVAWYGYDGGGERAMKLSGECVTLTQNGSPYTVASLTNPVVYASPLVTLTRRGYTKHYFEGERRICSAIGGGFTHVEWDSIDVSSGGGLWNTCDRLQQLLVGGVEEAMHYVEVNEMDIPDGVIHRMLRTEATKPQDDPEPVYYYHNDHLGGTAYLTDQTGQVAQTLAYLPYGEDWVDVTAFMYDTSQIGFYQFNGKEKDPETDYLYYGARYYWPDAWNGWLSPDPLMDDYPSISPYAYCAWNPVNLVDPDGMEIWKPEILDNGSINYVAEKGDNAKTLHEQYDISSSMSEKMYASLQDGKISGESAKEITGNEVLKMRWSNNSDSKKAYHLGFAIMYNHEKQDDKPMILNDYFSDIPQATGENCSINTPRYLSDITDKILRRKNESYSIPVKGGRSIPVLFLDCRASGRTMTIRDCGGIQSKKAGTVNLRMNYYGPGAGCNGPPVIMIQVQDIYEKIFIDSYGH